MRYGLRFSLVWLPFMSLHGFAAAENMTKVYVHGIPVEVFEKQFSHHVVTVGDSVVIRSDNADFVFIEGIYEGDGRTYVLVREWGGGASCPGDFQAIDMSSPAPQVSKIFGDCAVLTDASVSGGALIVAFKALDGKSTETFSFRDGVLTSAKAARSLEPSGPEKAPGGDLAAFVLSKPIGEVFMLRAATDALHKVMPSEAFEEARDMAISGPGLKFEVRNEVVRASACQAHLCPFHSTHIVFDHAGNAWASILSDDGKLTYYGNPPPQIRTMLNPK